MLSEKELLGNLLSETKNRVKGTASERDDILFLESPFLAVNDTNAFRWSGIKLNSGEKFETT